MSRAAESPPGFWETRNYRGRPFFHFDLKVPSRKTAEVNYTVRYEW